MVPLAPDFEVLAGDPRVLHGHVRLFAQGSKWFLEDLGSTNGTYLQDQRLSRATVVDPGARFRVGRTVMELRP